MKHIIFIIMTMSLLLNADYKKLIEVTSLPINEATMLKNNTVYKDITFHAKTITEDEETNFFNDTLMSDGFIPILVTITNTSRKKITIYGSLTKVGIHKNINVQILLEEYQTGHLAGLKTVVKFLNFGLTPGGHEAENQGYDEAKKYNFNDKSLHTELLYPGQSVSGFVYFNQKGFDITNKLEIPVQVMNTINKESAQLRIN